MNKFDENKYKWKGFNPRIRKSYKFRLKPYVLRGANFREIEWLWFRLCLSWWYNYRAVWSDGWDACFRQEINSPIKLKGVQVSNRQN